MNYFIESVTTYCITGKTKKGALLQEVAKLFEHTQLSEYTMKELVAAMRKLVAVLNDELPGKPLKVEYRGASIEEHGRITVLPAGLSNDNYVFTISIAAMRPEQYAMGVGSAIFGAVESLHGDLMDKIRQRGGEQ